jgi:hypothetical protein
MAEFESMMSDEDEDEGDGDMMGPEDGGDAIEMDDTSKMDNGDEFELAEGIDLKGDASRFQIICKVPYPYLGDKLVQKRMRKWSWWYPLQTAKTVIQALGRSIRSSDDFAVSYILDSDWNRFYGQNQEMFPDTFKEAVQNT